MIKRKSWLSRVGIVVIAAILVEVTSIVQYNRVRNIILDQMAVRSQIVVHSMAAEIGHALELTEYAMRENLWEVRRGMANPDSVYISLQRLVDDNPHVLGGCLAFVPNYYPSKGRLYEPYVFKENGKLVRQQLAGPDHDYTRNEAYQRVMSTGTPVWSEPYVYGPDSLELTTYSYPVKDHKGRIAGVCGLDMDLTWLGDTLNAHQHFPSSFGLLLNQKGELVAYPSESRTPWKDVELIMDILSGKVPESAHPEYSFERGALDRSPYWQVVQVYKTDEFYARLRKVRHQQLLFILLGLGILAFMINRYARSEQKLREAFEDNARIAGELKVANDIQQNILPPRQYHQDDVDICASLVPARGVGGDLFDYFVRDGKLFFCIGDVSGKGAASAMLMAVTLTLFRSAASHENNPARIMSLLNESACKRNENNMFVTLFVGVLDLPTGQLRYCNAGHDCPLVMGKSLSAIESRPHLPVGVFDNVKYTVEQCAMEAGSTLLLYTDGLTEAKNANREQFGLPRIKQILESAASKRPEDILQTLSDRLKRFVGEAEQSDDLTLMAIGYTPQPFESILDASVTLKNKVEEVPRLNGFMKEMVQKMQLSQSLGRELRLAVEEAVVNVIEYAYPPGKEGDVAVEMLTDGTVLKIRIEDSGVPFDPTLKEKADTSLSAEDRPIGGLGILLVRELMDTINYERSQGKNILTLMKRIK